ncbi:MAG: tRNA 2-thiouridine(34) synthase MnmA [Eubacterium sp.]|nr:tRNA 2-thiouridine(34) synthase MnmA [Eubacterium sp.]
MKKALIAMSGGVDSSVAAYLMKEKGYKPLGVTMLLHGETECIVGGTKTCCTIDDVEDARIVASYLGMEFATINYQEFFKEEVIDRFIETYMQGQTPNPCIDCNKYMKFGRLIDYAREHDCQKVVTGHYARIIYDEEANEYKLMRAKDSKKDQTYVLYFLNQEQLSMLEFPDGEYEKEQIREIADREDLPVAHKSESQDICFIPDGDYAGFIERQDDIQPVGQGDFLDTAGSIRGKHKGYYHYTIGQRRGLGIAADQPLYVVDINPDENVVTLGYNDALFTNVVQAHGFNLISGDKAFGDKDQIKLDVTAKIRYRAVDMPGQITIGRDGNATMIFDSAVRAPAPGQSLVIYDGDYCLGGGIINRRIT